MSVSWAGWKITFVFIFFLVHNYFLVKSYRTKILFIIITIIIVIKAYTNKCV